MYKGWPTIVTISNKSHETALKAIKAVNSIFLKVYWQDDVIGCELAGALKNVLALGAGYISGAGYGINTMSAWITRYK